MPIISENGTMLKIYLAGPMDDLTNDVFVMTGWRDKASEYFSDHNVKIYDPCRRPHTSDLSHSEIFALDMIDVRNCDMLLVDCRILNNVSSYGTPCEVFYSSYILNKPVIGWYDPIVGYKEHSVFQNVLVTRMMPTLESALDHISTYYIDDI